ncbi:phosphatase PAP2 family protein [Paraburkholderia kirstenboschensis]|uniref:phosphatase PAP2 family protein n=1 Tax=Paraburkholderia kirstenboschensis TaxID=1245436 RepID=UPI000FFC61C4|nr:phosphatase PAP2 family protein [Paraburkholderia kirstenboschensis]
MTKLEALNHALFLMINGTASTPTWQIAVTLLIADYLIYLIPALLVGMWLSGDDEQRSLAIRACLVAMLGAGANQLIALGWQHPRPLTIGLGHTFLPHSPDSSFPSDHATVFAGVALTLLLGGLRRLGGLALFVGAAVAWARVFVGVHFPLDMVGAIVVACLAYALITPLWRIGGRSVTLLAIGLYRKLLTRPIALGWLRR